MKKLLTALLLVALFSVSASAEVTGALAKGNATAETFRAQIVQDKFGYSTLAAVFDKAVNTEDFSVRFYDSLSLMLMALNKGEIDSISVPQTVGEQILRTSPEYTLRGHVIFKNPTALAFGFLKDKAELCERFSKAIEEMENDGTNGLLLKDYISGPNAANPPAVKFEHYDDAETINVAVTGDLPPIDYIAADGTPSGYNTALLAALGRKLHVNINPVNIETVSRAAALTSGRVDAVFWFERYSADASQAENYSEPDVPDGVILSTPYWGWSNILMIGRK